MPELDSKHILLGITGGIAAYKTPALVRLLRQAGAEVQIVMSASARHFVTPTVLQALGGLPVRDDLWDGGAEAAMGHIELARWADLVLVAPATADVMARLAGGRADDLLTTLCLATPAPLWLAPAMNQGMWRHPAVQRNRQRLVSDGVLLLGPDEGEQACGDTGPGRMVEPEAILAAISAPSATPTETEQILLGLNVLITAGPTVEAIDPVRYISNHSSGKQGYAIAECAAAMGAEVTLVSGPTRLDTPVGVTRIDVQSARDMHDRVHENIAGQDIFIGVAAVADYRPAAAADQKIKKQGDAADHTLILTENPDIIASVAALPERPLIVGFAAETELAEEHARQKRQCKGLDAIVVNDVSKAQIGFNSDYNSATLIWEQGEVTLPFQGKEALSRQLLEQLMSVFGMRLTVPPGALGPT